MKHIVVLMVGIFAISFISGCSSGQGKYNSFAQCLTDNGVKMFGTEWCSHCKNQKKTFGSSFDYVDYIDCDKYKDECLSNGVNGYPTWIINGSSYPGEQPLSRLASLSGCELVKDEV